MFFALWKQSHVEEESELGSRPGHTGLGPQTDNFKLLASV
jgi:hypothetical protein